MLFLEQASDKSNSSLYPLPPPSMKAEFLVDK